MQIELLAVEEELDDDHVPEVVRKIVEVASAAIDKLVQHSVCVVEQLQVCQVLSMLAVQAVGDALNDNISQNPSHEQ